MLSVGFEPTISEGEQPQTYALDRTVTGTKFQTIHPIKMQLFLVNIKITDTKQLESKQGDTWLVTEHEMKRALINAQNEPTQ